MFLMLNKPKLTYCTVFLCRRSDFMQKTPSKSARPAQASSDHLQSKKRPHIREEVLFVEEIIKPEAILTIGFILLLTGLRFATPNGHIIRGNSSSFYLSTYGIRGAADIFDYTVSSPTVLKQGLNTDTFFNCKIFSLLRGSLSRINLIHRVILLRQKNSSNLYSAK